MNANQLKILVFKHGIGITGWTLNKIIWIHTSYHNQKNFLTLMSNAKGRVEGTAGIFLGFGRGGVAN